MNVRFPAPIRALHFLEENYITSKLSSMCRTLSQDFRTLSSPASCCHCLRGSMNITHLLNPTTDCSGIDLDGHFDKHPHAITTSSCQPIADGDNWSSTLLSGKGAMISKVGGGSIPSSSSSSISSSISPGSVFSTISSASTPQSVTSSSPSPTSPPSSTITSEKCSSTNLSMDSMNYRYERKQFNSNYSHASQQSYHQPYSFPQQNQSISRLLMIGGPLDKQSSSEIEQHKSKDVALSSIKRFNCFVCSKGFARKSDLVRHERIHTGDRPNVCTICKKQFIQRSALTVHIRVHTGEKPHKCEECHKAFSDSSSLARHRRVHTGNRPYQCTVTDCGRTFTRRTALMKHRFQAHAEHESSNIRKPYRQPQETVQKLSNGFEVTGDPNTAAGPRPTVAGSQLMYHRFQSLPVPSNFGRDAQLVLKQGNSKYDRAYSLYSPNNRYYGDQRLLPTAIANR